MTQRIDIRYDNEFSRVSRYINTLADNLQYSRETEWRFDDLTKTASVNQKTSSETQVQLNSQREQTATVASSYDRDVSFSSRSGEQRAKLINHGSTK